MLRRLLVLAVLAGLAIGCGGKSKDRDRARVSGKVTLDGKPLKTGKITFDPQNGEPPVLLDILDGLYEGKAPVGKNKVQLTSIRLISMREKMKMDGPGYDQPVEENILPARYNFSSKITREVEAEGENTFNFPLESK